MVDRFEALAEQRIQAALERGEFDDLPGAGSRLGFLDRPYDPAWWSKEFARRERMADATRSAQAAAERELGRIWPLRSATVVRRRVAELNHHVVAAGGEPFDIEEIVALWRRFAIYRRSAE